MITLLELNKVDLLGRDGARLMDVSIKLHAGETVALLGPSGAGKSSLLAIANGSITPSSGQVSWRGKPLRKRSKRDRRSIGTLWQDLHLVEELTVLQNVNCGALGRRSLMWALANLLFPVDSIACRRCLQQAGLPEEMMHRPVSALSGGQRQRVALARLFRQQPELVLADEPLSSLDPALVEELLNTLLRQSPSDPADTLPNSTVICLHRPDLIHRFDRVIGLKQGQVVLDAPAADVSQDQLHDLYQRRPVPPTPGSVQ